MRPAHGQDLQPTRSDPLSLLPLSIVQRWARTVQRRFYSGLVQFHFRFGGIKNTDLYQLLAYTIAANVPYGLLVYAAGEGEPAYHQVPAVGKTLEVAVLDVKGEPDAILSSIASLAGRIRNLRAMNLCAESVT